MLLLARDFQAKAEILVEFSLVLVDLPFFENVHFIRITMVRLQ